jgi:hypothetical protein
MQGKVAFLALDTARWEGADRASQWGRGFDVVSREGNSRAEFVLSSIANGKSRLEPKVDEPVGVLP